MTLSHLTNTLMDLVEGQGGEEAENTCLRTILGESQVHMEGEDNYKTATSSPLVWKCPYRT